PVLILDQHFRKLEELFRPETFDALSRVCDIRGGQNWPMARERVTALLPEATFYVAAQPQLTEKELEGAPLLRATIEVSGAFREGLDYGACFARGVEVLSCAPGFRQSVAEMTLAMMLTAGRGLVEEHEAMRRGAERWLDDRDGTDFTLYGQSIGFIGYGEIARETRRLLAPFSPTIMASDPYVTAPGPEVTLCDLDTLASTCRVVVVTAVPSEETRGILSADLIARLRPGALVVVISRAWCTDFPALVDAALAGRIKLATDVYPDEPLEAAHPLRQARNVILSPHRAAAVPGGRHLIGDMILHDVTAILEGRSGRHLKVADPALIRSLVSAQSQMHSMPNT
ncbi:MAG: NAD(P)-dependent oxidoreductase, partial [Pseudomonadota bacterium]